MFCEYQLKEKTIKETNTLRLNNTFLNKQQVTEEIKREIKKFLEINENENMTTQNLLDAAKPVLKGKFIAIQSYFKKQEKHQKDNLTLHLKQVGKKGEENKQASKKKTKNKKPKLVEGKKSLAEINEKEMKDAIGKINKTKSRFFEKIKWTNT